MRDIDKLAQKIAEALEADPQRDGSGALHLSAEEMLPVIAAELREAEGELVATWMENELADYRMVLDHCTRTYYHFSGGRISKPNTYPEEVFAIAADLQSRDIEEAVAEATQEQGWQKFPDSLPPRHQNVWCLNRDGYQFEGRICYGLHAPFFTYPRGDGSPSNTVPRWIDVTHWRPLPSPPEE